MAGSTSISSPLNETSPTKIEYKNNVRSPNKENAKKYANFVIKKGVQEDESTLDIINMPIETIKTGFNLFIKFMVESLTDSYNSIIDFTDIPDKFDYSYISVAYFWSFIITSAKQIGHSVGKCELGKYLIGSIFGLPATALITYILLPLRLFLIKRITDHHYMTVAERRLDLIFNAFIFGICVENIINSLELDVSDGSVTYYLPIVLVASITIVGPRLGKNRLQFIGVIMSIALVVSFLLVSIFSKIDKEYFLGLLLDMTFSFFNIQFLITNLRKPKDERDMTSGQTMSLILSLYTHLIITLITGGYFYKKVVSKIDI
uniref:SLC29A4 n=1 Tax=Parastrongyloides trichosuri TaxID=131310 RepID=A0A0N4Z6G6_PARTI